MPLSETHQRRLSAAEGYLTLGLFDDAAAELDSLPAEPQGCEAVLTVRLALCQATGRWAAMQAAARRLLALEPAADWFIALAYGTRRAESIEQARLILMEALDRHPLEPLVHYNLACYDCQLGDVPSAKRFIERALRLKPSMGRMALEDEDLAPIWASLAHDLSED